MHKLVKHNSLALLRYHNYLLRRSDYSMNLPSSQAHLHLFEFNFCYIYMPITCFNSREFTFGDVTPGAGGRCWLLFLWCFAAKLACMHEFPNSGISSGKPGTPALQAWGPETFPCFWPGPVTPHTSPNPPEPGFLVLFLVCLSMSWCHLCVRISVLCKMRYQTMHRQKPICIVLFVQNVSKTRKEHMRSASTCVCF